MAGRSVNSIGGRAKDWAPGPPSSRYNVSGKDREYYTFENAPGVGAYATGGSIIDGGDGYIYHIFTGSGTFVVNRPSAAIDSVQYLIAAGGGSNGPSAGGGAGGLLVGNISVSNTPGSYPIIVGGGGSPGSNGNPSSVFGITATGGGRGAPPSSPGPQNGNLGGSGGGSFTGPPGSPAGGGVGNTPATIPRQGYPGGASGPTFTVGGGGGAGGPGGFPNLPGRGKIVPQFPAPVVGQSIPEGSRQAWISALQSNGFSKGAPHSAGIGVVNSGYGGGFSGIVCIRYRKNPPYERATGGTVEPSTHPEHPGVWRHIFTSPGTFTITDPSLQRIDYLAVGGGGGGGGFGPPVTGGGGGGAGGFVSSIHTSSTTPTIDQYPWNPEYSIQVGSAMPVGVGSYPINIGSGGAGGSTAVPGSDGTNTTIGAPGVNQIIAYGGGGGASAPSFLNQAGRAGASGGGGFRSPGPGLPGSILGGTATPSPNSQGNNGGSGAPVFPSANSGGGGGGGAGGPGGAGPTGAGGAGWYSVLSPSSYGTPGPLSQRYFAGGGGGGGGNLAPTAAGAGGVGGGGAGTPLNTPGPANPGTINTGGGGGGSTTPGVTGGAGGPGIVIIEYSE